MSLKTKTVEWLARTAMRFPRTFWFFVRAWEWTRQKCQEATPGERSWKGAALGLFVATVVVVADSVLHRSMLPAPTYDRVANAVRGVREAALYGVGMVVLATVIARTPWRYRLMLGACAGVLASSFPFSADDRVLWVSVVAFSVAGAALAVISREDISVITRFEKGIAIVGIVFGISTVGYLLYWVMNPGFDPIEYRNAASEAETEGTASVVGLALPDPSETGPYEVLYLTYGSGVDIRRPEFGRDADLITETVDGRPFLTNWSGRSGNERKDFWGFDRDELPLQGRVWYPDGDGPFPLVLIVHGNHSMYEYSDPGYKYLGELLASRGYILVSVDENFINGNISRENDARGWLLLEHLKVWAQWNEGEVTDDSGDNGAGEGAVGKNEQALNPFVGEIDMSRIGLIGHSRGGEAVAVAAAFNTLPYYPDDATVPFGYNFDISAVIAIAPVMGQYQPGGRYTDLLDINYFVIHGANDGDVSSFSGASQYEHVAFSGDPYRFKSSLYVMGANHGQFNQVWGDHDSGKPSGRALSTRSLIAEQDQRKIAEVYISAFLEATLRSEFGYLPLFADAREGKNWLPETAYLVEFDDAHSMKVATFDEDIDVTTATLAGGSTMAENLTVWREQRVSMKSRTKETAGVYLGWEVLEEAKSDEVAYKYEREAGDEPDKEPIEGNSATELEDDASTPRYIIHLPARFVVDPASVLFFSLADADESSAMPAHLTPDEGEQDNQEGKKQGWQEQKGQHQPAEQKEEQQDSLQHKDAKSNKEGEDEREDEDAPREPIDFTIRLVDAGSNVAEVLLSRFSMVQPQLEVQLRKTFADDPRTDSEAVFQSFLLPLTWFLEANPEFDVSRPARIEFVFDRSPSGVVILDSVGFRVAPGS
jgi:dienelactone hydrolase